MQRGVADAVGDDVEPPEILGLPPNEAVAEIFNVLPSTLFVFVNTADRVFRETVRFADNP